MPDNPYYTRRHGESITPGSKVRSVQINDEFNAIEYGFSLLPEINLDGSFNQAITIPDGTDPGHAVNLGQVTTLVDDNVDPLETEILTARGGFTDLNARLDNIAAGGGGIQFGSIPVTSLNIGTATPGQWLGIDSTGSAIIGRDFDPSGIQITGLAVGSATADQIIAINSTGSAVIGKTASFAPDYSALRDGIPVVKSFAGSDIAAREFVSVSADSNISHNRNYLVDVSGGPITLTLTGSPQFNDTIYIAVGAGNPAGANITLTGQNVSTRAGTDTTVIVDVAIDAFYLIHNGTEWRLVL